ncbi:hypothetical protein [Sulfurimonas sp.]|uniref:hypothetical protein n=1 Tax=Sulfurimonas sp. TaxID=2022749 RepID=UPI003566004B
MKIENYSIAMQSKHCSSTTVSHLFEQELVSLNQGEDIQNTKATKVQEIESSIEFAKRLELTFIQNFIQSLSNNSVENSTMNIRSIEDIQRDIISNRYSKNNFKAVDFESFKPRKLMSQEVTLTKQIEHKECLDVSMEGCIQTVTQKIKLDIDFSLSSTFVEKHQLTKTMFFDPLVLNFEGDIPNLDSNKFSFDIDCDGEVDQISKLGEGCGFLALDSNNNGSIDDGTELFGTQSGNGFYDLRRYDDDNNGWIDESDSILDSLRIWKKTDTEDELVALGEMGIGAIYLGYSEQDFNLKTYENETLGRIRSNGLFLNEDGSSGVVSQIDFAKKDSKLSELIQSA